MKRMRSVSDAHTRMNERPMTNSAAFRFRDPAATTRSFDVDIFRDTPQTLNNSQSEPYYTRLRVLTLLVFAIVLS